MSLFRAFQEADRLTAASVQSAAILDQIEASALPKTTPGFNVVHKSDIPDRRRQLVRVTEFFGNFLDENANCAALGGTCTMFLRHYQRGKRGVTGTLKLLRPSTEGGLHVKIQPEGSGDCTLHSVVFPRFTGTEQELFELLVAGNGGSSTWPNREPGQRPQHSDGEHHTVLINRTKLRGRLRQNAEDLNELLEALDLHVSEGNRRVTPVVLQAAIETAFGLSMKNEADYMHIIKWLHEAEHLTRENGEKYMLPERIAEPDEVTEDESEEEGQEPVTEAVAADTDTERATEQPPAPTSQVDPLAELASFEQLAQEHKAHEALRKELVSRLDRLRMDAHETVQRLQRYEEQIAELTRQADQVRDEQQRITAEQQDLEAQVSALEAEGAQYAAVAARVKALAALFASDS